MEIKYDGNACALQYKDGLLVKALSRGDGIQGEDIFAGEYAKAVDSK